MPERMTIGSKLDAARGAEEAVLRQAVACGYGQTAVFAIRLALEEALNNAIKHGNGYDESKTVDIAFDVNPNRAEVTITDQGSGFDPHSIPDPTADENLEKPCGRGIMLMRAYMDEVEYSTKGNQVRIVKVNC